MAETPDPNTLSPGGRGRSMTLGDVPAAIRRRYYVDGRGFGGLAFYVDATIATPAFRDRGHRLTTPRGDPNAVRHMVEIAGHRGWDTVLVRGEASFRREAWLAGRLAALDVRGYRPTERDLEELMRRLAAQRSRPDRPAAPGPEAPETRPPRDPGARRRLQVVETVVRTRIADREDQARILAAARARLADWLERGAIFPVPAARQADRRSPRHTPDRGR